MPWSVRDYSRIMRTFWDDKARDDAHFYIATWLGYRRRRDESFFDPPESIADLLATHGYDVPPRARILEIGCGIRRMTRGLAQLFDSVHAVDVSWEMLLRAAGNLRGIPNVRLYQISGTDLALFRDNSFDFCFSYLVFQHIPEFGITCNYILEASRCLKPGGAFLFQVNNRPVAREYSWRVLRELSRWWRRWGWHTLLELRATLTRGPRGFDHPAWMGHCVTVPQLRQAVAAAGLELEGLQGEGTQYLWALARKPRASR